jgi:hypothetical protein
MNHHLCDVRQLEKGLIEKSGTRTAPVGAGCDAYRSDVCRHRMSQAEPQKVPPFYACNAQKVLLALKIYPREYI